jgi:hypothetical protein
MPTRTKVLPIAEAEENDLFARINTKIMRKTLARINYGCEVQERMESRGCTQGTLIDDLVMGRITGGLPPAPGEDTEAAKTPAQPKRKRAKRAKRSSEPKAMSA